MNKKILILTAAAILVASAVVGYNMFTAPKAPSGSGTQTTPTEAGTTTNKPDEESDSSGSITFEVKPIIKEITTRHDGEKETPGTEYGVVAVIAWPPHPYTVEYTLEFNFNGNMPEPFVWHDDWTDKGKYTKAPYAYSEGKIYRLDGDPDQSGYIGIHKDFTEFLGIGTRDGIHLVGVREVVNDNENWGEAQVLGVKNEMRTWVDQYVDKWTVSVRALSGKKPG